MARKSFKKKKRISKKKRLRIKRKKPLYKKKGFWISLFILSVFIGASYFFFFSKVFCVKNIRILGNEQVSSQEIFEVADSQILRNILCFRTKNIFLLSSGKLEKEVLSNFPIIEKVIIKKEIPDSLLLKIKERQIFANLCFSSGECCKIDKQGVCFQAQESETHLIILVPGQRDFSLGKQEINPEYVNSISLIQEKLEGEIGVGIEKFILSGQKLDVRTKDDFDIYFDFGQDIEKQLLNLSLVLDREISQDRVKSLEYIDLRFESKVFYK